MANETRLRPLPMTEYLPGPVTQAESRVDGIEYFREYIIPSLTANKAYVSVRCTPLDPANTPYSVLIKKTDYNKWRDDVTKLAKECQKYTDYYPIEMSVSTILNTDKHGANISYVTYSQYQGDEWMRTGANEYYIRNIDSIRREAEASGVKRKEEKEARAEARLKQKYERLQAFSLEMIDKMS